ncbi:MAG: type II toxin-antitoxin system RelE family toxin [Treponema sp.]
MRTPDRGRLERERILQDFIKIGEYRLICAIHDNTLVILALTVGHRRAVYDE